MNDVEMGERVAVMLRERAADITDRPAPAFDGRAPVELDPAASERPRAWLAVAAVVAVLVGVGVVALVLQDDGDRVDTGPVDDPPTVPSTLRVVGPVVPLNIAVRQRQASSYAHGSLAVLEVTDAAGARIGELYVAPPFRLYDPDAEPGSVGSDMVTGFLDVEVPPGEYTISVWQYPCLAEGCPQELPAEALDADRVDECTGDVTAVRNEGGSLTVVFTPGEGCNYVGPTREEDFQAGQDLLQRQIENGWVPYGGRPAMPDFVVPRPQGAWIPAGFDGDLGCERPPEIPDPVGMQCIRDAPEGELIGYHISNLGFVPLDRLEEFDINQAYLDFQGCSPLLDETCELRQQLAFLESLVTNEDLSPEQRELHEREIEELERQIAELEAGD